MIKPIVITRSQCTFFFSNGQYFCSVRIPRGYTVYMNMGNDNRPHEDVVKDIQAAVELLSDSYVGDVYLREVNIAIALPSVLGYKRSDAMLH